MLNSLALFSCVHLLKPAENINGVMELQTKTITIVALYLSIYLVSQKIFVSWSNFELVSDDLLFRPEDLCSISCRAGLVAGDPSAFVGPISP